MGKVIAIANQKGGVGKTTTAAPLGDLLNKYGSKVLMIDMDGQANLTYNMGINPYKLSKSITNLLLDKVNDEPMDYESVELEIRPGLSLFPSNIELAGLEMSLINAFQREQVLSMIIREIREQYDYIIIDTSPSLGLLTINSLVAVDEVVIPVQAQVFAIKGMEQLFRSISLAKRVNLQLQIAGFLLTMVDGRSDTQRDTAIQLEQAFGSAVKKFETVIPLQVNGSRASKEQQAITSFDPKGAAAKAYRDWLAEYMGLTPYFDDKGRRIEIGDILELENNNYLVNFGEYERERRDGRKILSKGVYVEPVRKTVSHNGTNDKCQSMGSFMQQYRRPTMNSQ